MSDDRSIPESGDGNAADEVSQTPLDSAPVAPGGTRPSLTPGAARRRLGAELRTLREAAGLNLQEAGNVIERSAATISRFEMNRYMPRSVDILALLDRYRAVIPDAVSDETRERILSLLAQGRQSEWYSSFKDANTGEVIPDHTFKLVEYETDARRIRNYESDLVPGLLQSYEYAQAVAQIFFPDSEPVEHARFAEFRITRKARLDGRHGLRLYFVVNEVALRRELGTPDVLRSQLLSLMSVVRGGMTGVELQVIPQAAAVPAAMNGPFSIMSFPEGSEDRELVYLESRSGATYLADAASVRRFAGYFAALQAAALSADDAVGLIESIVQNLQH